MEQTRTAYESSESALSYWPVQLKLVPVNAPYLNGAGLLISSDCSPFAFSDFHRHFMGGKVVC